MFVTLIDSLAFHGSVIMYSSSTRIRGRYTSLFPQNQWAMNSSRAMPGSILVYSPYRPSPFFTRKVVLAFLFFVFSAVINRISSLLDTSRSWSPLKSCWSVVVAQSSIYIYTKSPISSWVHTWDFSWRTLLTRKESNRRISAVVTVVESNTFRQNSVDWNKVGSFVNCICLDSTEFARICYFGTIRINNTKNVFQEE